jgi:hypothetical protein
MVLNWGKCQGDNWCSFMRLTLESHVFDNALGIYIIWSNAISIKVGSGNIRNEIERDRENNQIKLYPESTLKVTWCIVDSSQIDGVKTFLVNRLRPVIMETVGSANPIEVNLPWV